MDSGNGVLAVNISSKKTGLNRHKKSKWAAVIAKQIRDTLQGHAIYAADGDIIRITDRAPGEVSYGTNSNILFAEAKKTGDYSAFNKKRLPQSMQLQLFLYLHTKVGVPIRKTILICSRGMV